MKTREEVMKEFLLWLENELMSEGRLRHRYDNLDAVFDRLNKNLDIYASDG